MFYFIAGEYISGPDNRSYRLHTQKVTWPDAKKICESENSHLAFDDTPKTHTFISQKYGHFSYVWLGASSTINGRWTWLNGNPVFTSYWDTGEPNSIDDIENCLNTNQHGAKGKWNDASCRGYKFMFLCQKDNTKGMMIKETFYM